MTEEMGSLCSCISGEVVSIVTWREASTQTQGPALSNFAAPDLTSATADTDEPSADDELSLSAISFIHDSRPLTLPGWLTDPSRQLYRQSAAADHSSVDREVREQETFCQPYDRSSYPFLIEVVEPQSRTVMWETPETQETWQMPATQETQQTPETLKTQEMRESQEVRETQDMPETQEIQVLLETEERQQTPETQEMPKTQQTLETLETQETPEMQEIHEVQETPEMQEIQEVQETQETREMRETQKKWLESTTDSLHLTVSEQDQPQLNSMVNLVSDIFTVVFCASHLGILIGWFLSCVYQGSQQQHRLIHLHLVE